VLVDDYGLDLTGWKLWKATAISDDGLTIVGSGENPNGETEAWIAYLGTDLDRPDLWIKKGKIWLGDNFYNTDGTGQTRRRTVSPGTTAVYRARLYNDGDQTETFTLRGPAGNADWTVKYYGGPVEDPAREVTSQVTSPQGWNRSHIPPGAFRCFLMTVTPRSGLPSENSYAFLVQAGAQRDPTQQDTLKIVTRVR